MDRPLASTQLQKKWPVLLLNATEVRTGGPIVLSNSDFPEASPAYNQNHAIHGFHQVYPGRDVFLESAVRMSAALPYVFPPARSDTPWNAEHLVDGEYSDNSGLSTLTKWLKAAIPELSPAGRVEPTIPSKKKILILRIDTFPDGQWSGPDDAPQKWSYELIAPILVRSAGHLVSDLSDNSNLLQILSLRGYEAASLTARYAPSDEARSSTAGVNCPQDPPLAWRLTEVEKTCIDQAWEALKPAFISQINDFFGAVPVPPSNAPAHFLTMQVKKGLYLQKSIR